VTVGRVVRARLLALWRDLRGAVTLRRTEKRAAAYALRLLCLVSLLVVLPVAKLVQLGPLGAILAFLKAGVAVALVVAVLATYFAAGEIARRRGAARRAREGSA
jgi:uncharacterized RDD family membrane protein YckC